MEKKLKDKFTRPQGVKCLFPIMCTKPRTVISFYKVDCGSKFCLTKSDSRSTRNLNQIWHKLHPKIKPSGFSRGDK